MDPALDPTNIVTPGSTHPPLPEEQRNKVERELELARQRLQSEERAAATTLPAEPEADGKHHRGIFGESSALEVRFVADYARVEEIAKACHALGLRIVLTSGTFDILHIGHAKYLEKAKSYGDILIVGVDSDIKVRERKGPDRPVVPETERVEMLAHLRSVDIVTLKTPQHAKWELAKRVRPDTLIATEGTYDTEQIGALKEFVGDVVVLDPQATTSTTARLRRMRINFAKDLAPAIAELLQKMADQA